MLERPVHRPVSKRKQCASFLQRVTTVEVRAGTKKDFLIVVPLGDGCDSTGSLLIINRTADAIASLQASLARARCSHASCRVCAHFSDLPRLPTSLSDRLLLRGREIHGHFEARLARIVHSAAALTATAPREAKCVAQYQSIVATFFTRGLSQLPP